MNTFEITIQRAHDGGWPVVVRHQPGPIALTSWAQGNFDLDLKRLDLLLPTDHQYGMLLGQKLFRAEVHDAFVRAVSGARANSEPLRVLLIVEAENLRSLHWEQLCGTYGTGRWDYLLLNQQTPFSLYLPSQIERRFPPIGRRDLRALLLVAGPEELAGDYGLATFDVPATIAALTASLGEIPHDVLANSGEGNAGEPSLRTLTNLLTDRHYTLLFIVSHGAYRAEDGETILYFPADERGRPVTGSRLIERLSRIDGPYGLPHFTFLSTCESADPQAENGLGGLGQRLVRELGMPAVLAMTDRVSIQTAQDLSESFCTRLSEHGEVDRALVETLTTIKANYDLTVPALFSRLGGRPLFSDALDRQPSATEIRYGLEQMSDLLEERAPVLIDEFLSYRTKIQSTLDTDPDTLSQETHREREAALAKINQLGNRVLDISFNALALGQKPPEYDPRPPFRGLYPFRTEDREFFFGRQALVDDLMTRLDKHNFLAVLGPSGCGKSSLVLAGLVPGLDTPMAYLTPGDDPVANLENALVGAEPGRLLVVDQFEELFTLCRDQTQREVFLEMLLKTTGEMPVVITMRADFLGECTAYPGLRRAIEAHQALIGPMSAAELRRAMERQADHVGLRFEAGLGEQILDDVQGEPGAMPLLQHALLLLWQRRHGRWLRWEEYTAIGGIQEAIAHTAEEVYAGLNKHEKRRVRDIFIRLTRPPEVDSSQEGDRYTRRRVRLAELVPAGSDRKDTIRLVNCMADARLLVTRQREGEGEVEVEVAHEALIQNWPRLRNWLEENRADIRLREALTRAARDWESHDRDEGALYRGAHLAQASEWEAEHPGELNVLEKEFLVASRESVRREEKAREEQRQRELRLLEEKAVAEQLRAEQQTRTATRLRKRAVYLTIAMILAAITSIGAIYFGVQAQRQARRSLAVGLAAFAENQLDQDFDLALLLGVEAYKTSNTSQSRRALFEAWIHIPQLTGFLHGHEHQVMSVAWSRDGYLASGSADGTVIVWDLERGQPAKTLRGHSDWVTSVAWSTDGHLASGSEDGDVIVWDLEIGQPAQILRGHEDWVDSVAWSPDRRLASGSSDQTVIVWDMKDGQPAQILQGHNDWVNNVAWSPDGHLASGSVDGTVIIWDLESGQPAQTMRGHQDWVNSVAWSIDGRLASGSGDRTIIIWDLESGQPIQTLLGHERGVESVAWSIDGRLASGSVDGTVIIWDLESGQPIQRLQGHSSFIRSVAWSKDGLLASGSGDRTIIIWDLERDQPSQTLKGHNDIVSSVAWSSDGRLASGSGNETIIVWDLESGRPTQTLNGHSGVYSLVWSSNRRLASGSYDGNITIWDLESGQPAQVLQGHEKLVKSLAWSDDGRLASGSSDGTVIVWDLERGQPVQILRGSQRGVRSVAWSGDGRLASGAGDRTIIIWNLESGQPAQTLQGHEGGVESVAWSVDGRLASGSSDGTVIVWDLESGQPTQTLQGHKGPVHSLAWSTDGRLSSGSRDRTVIVWDLESGQPAQTLEGHTSYVLGVAWSTDGRLASGSWDSTVQVWDMTPEVWVEPNCQRAGRNLTQHEWSQYFPGEGYRKTCHQWPPGE